MKKDREIWSHREHREILCIAKKNILIYSLVRSSDLTVLLTADAKASGVRSRRNLNDLRVVLNKPSGGKTSSGRLEN